MGDEIDRRGAQRLGLAWAHALAVVAVGAGRLEVELIDARLEAGEPHDRAREVAADIVVLDTNPPVIAETAANVHAAAEALDALAILALQEGQPVGAICHGGTVAGVFP